VIFGLGVSPMRRREFITLLGSMAAAWTFEVRAQQAPKTARIGFLGLQSAETHSARTAALHAGLRDLGYVEGSNIAIEYRWAEGNYDRLPALANELVRLNIEVLLTHATPGAIAAKNATTSTIPIVVTAIDDMLALGLVSSLSHPGGNITGLSIFGSELTAKRLELLKEAVPPLVRAALLLNPDNASSGKVLNETANAAQALQIELLPLHAREPSEFEKVFKLAVDQNVGAMFVQEDTTLTANARLFARLAIEYRLPSGGFPEFARAGCLIGNGINFPDTDYRAASFVDKILRGAKPGDLPVERASKFIVVVNLKTAKAIGLDVPISLLLRADEVIE
jgi:putative tryptophan/tyrosine transport system substrate-binding protein